MKTFNFFSEFISLHCQQTQKDLVDIQVFYELCRMVNHFKFRVFQASTERYIFPNPAALILSPSCSGKNAPTKEFQEKVSLCFDENIRNIAQDYVEQQKNTNPKGKIIYPKNSSSSYTPAQMEQQLYIMTKLNRGSLSVEVDEFADLLLTKNDYNQALLKNLKLISSGDFRESSSNANSETNYSGGFAKNSLLKLSTDYSVFKREPQVQKTFLNSFASGLARRSLCCFVPDDIELKYIKRAGRQLAELNTRARKEYEILFRTIEQRSNYILELDYNGELVLDEYAQINYDKANKLIDRKDVLKPELIDRHEKAIKVAAIFEIVENPMSEKISLSSLQNAIDFVERFSSFTKFLNYENNFDMDKSRQLLNLLKQAKQENKRISKTEVRTFLKINTRFFSSEFPSILADANIIAAGENAEVVEVKGFKNQVFIEYVEHQKESAFDFTLNFGLTEESIPDKTIVIPNVALLEAHIMRHEMFSNYQQYRIDNIKQLNKEIDNILLIIDESETKHDELAQKLEGLSCTIINLQNDDKKSYSIVILPIEKQYLDIEEEAEIKRNICAERQIKGCNCNLNGFGGIYSNDFSIAQKTISLSGEKLKINKQQTAYKPKHYGREVRA